MKNFSLLCLLFAFCCVSSDPFRKGEHVLDLNKESFDEALQSHEYLVVFFYAPNSLQAKKVFTEYSKAADTLKDKHQNVALSKVDASVEKDLAKRFDIVGYPTILFFIQATPVPFKGGRVHDSIVKFLETKIQAKAVSIESFTELTQLQAKNDVVVLGLFKNEDKREISIFRKIVKLFDGIQFAISYNNQLFNDLKANGDEAIIVLKNFDEGRNVYEGIFEENSIKKFITANHLLFIDKTKDEIDRLLAEYKTAAKKFKGQVIFGYIDKNLPESESLLGFFEVSKDSGPTVRLLSTDQMSKFKPEFTEIKAENIENFVQNYFDGKLKNTDIDINLVVYDLKNVEDFLSLQKEAKTLVVGLFKNQEGENAVAYKDFINNQSLEDIKFSITSESEIYAKLKIKDEEAILIFKKPEEKPNKFKGKFEISEIKRFVYLNHFPNVIELNQKTSLMIKDIGMDKINVLFASKKSGFFNRAFEEFEAASKKFKERVIFAVVDADERTNEGIMEAAKLTKRDLPTVRLFTFKEAFSKVFNPEYAEIRKEDVERYVQEFLDEMSDDDGDVNDDDDEENDDLKEKKKEEL